MNNLASLRVTVVGAGMMGADHIFRITRLGCGFSASHRVCGDECGGGSNYPGRFHATRRTYDSSSLSTPTRTAICYFCKPVTQRLKSSREHGGVADARLAGS